MPDLDMDDGADAQDGAEAFDETNREDELMGAAGDDFEDPDIAPDVYDVTTAIGDADDEDGRQYELDAADGVEDLDVDDLEEDEDEDESPTGGYEALAEDRRGGMDDRVDVSASRGAPSEPGLSYVDDIDDVTLPRDDEVEKYESTRELSDAQLSDLGYSDKEDAMTTEDAEKTRAAPEPRSFADDGSKPTVKGSGATADDVIHSADPAEEHRLDEGLEESFPASDPVSAKHIT